MSADCICVPCTTPAYGVPGLSHCAACCYGSLVVEFCHDCPIDEHSAMAELQWGPRGDVPWCPEHGYGCESSNCPCGHTIGCDCWSIAQEGRYG